MGRPLKLAVAWLLVLSILLMASLSASAADDVTGHWAEEEMRLMINERILKGDKYGYHPNKLITRGQFAALLARVLELEPTKNGKTFTDVDNRSGYLAEILGAAHAGIITGYEDGTFRPSDQINRQHMAVMMKRALDYLDIEGSDPDYRFADEEDILSTYRADLYKLAGAGIFKGSMQPDGSYLFRPMDNAHRWEAATVLARLIDRPVCPAVMIYHTASPVPDPTFTEVGQLMPFDSRLKVHGEYFDFEEAVAASVDGEVIAFATMCAKVTEEHITKLSNGGKVYARQITPTYIFDHPEDIGDSKKAYTYVSRDTMMEYIDATRDYVKVKLSGKTGFIKQGHTFMPVSNYGYSYYTVNSAGELVHHVSLNKGRLNRDYITQSYIIGKAPEAMNQQDKFFSWDQIDFEGQGEQSINSYNYYQFLSARTQTVYTAEELDDYIMEELERGEATGNEAYRDATKKSKLLGIGSLLKEIEEERNINALLLLAHAQHNSDYGMSEAAQENNNLFDVAADPEAAEKGQFLEYQSIEENIYVLADEWNENYITPNAKNAHGDFLGTKAVGINVKYSSDPYWGAKVAGQAYLVDKALGGRDYGLYKLGITQTAGVEARTSPNTGDNVVFKYGQTERPVTVIGTDYNEADNQTWYQVLSDEPNYEGLWIAEEDLQIVAE